MKKEDKIKNLVKKLIEAKECYYNSEPIMSDIEFDSLEDQLYELDPENYYFSIVGISIKGANKIKHNIPMLSCGKGKVTQDIHNWIKKINCNNEIFIEMPKIDGLSGTIKYVDGNLSYISTRGDGEIGQEITYLKDYLNIPLTLKEPLTGESRGEIYLPKDTEFDVEGKPLRNIASGLVGRKEEKDRQDCKHLKFVSYQSIGLSNKTTVHETLEDLKDLGFDIVEYKLIRKEEIEASRQEYLDHKRDEWKYETDGLVLTVDDNTKHEYLDTLYTVDHHHHYNIALKPPAAGQNTILRKIEWKVSKNGYLIPVAIFDPIYFSGRKVHRATLVNYGNVVQFDLKEGDEIFIVLANDVIPFFDKKLKDNNGKSLIIDTCTCCGSKLIIESNNAKKKEDEVLHARCTNKNCEDQIIKTIISYCESCEMEGVSSATIKTLYDNDLLKNIYDLYSLYLNRSKILLLNGFAESKTDNLLDQIEKSKKMNIAEFISRIGIEGVGEKSVVNLGINSVEDFLKFQSRTYVVGNAIIDFRDNNRDFVEKMIEIIQPTIVLNKDSKGKVCMTGKGPDKRNNLISKIKEMGYEFVESVNKETDILICENIEDNSSKLNSARKLGIKLMNYGDFFK